MAFFLLVVVFGLEKKKKGGGGGGSRCTRMYGTPYSHIHASSASFRKSPGASSRRRPPQQSCKSVYASSPSARPRSMRRPEEQQQETMPTLAPLAICRSGSPTPLATLPTPWMPTSMPC